MCPHPGSFILKITVSLNHVKGWLDHLCGFETEPRAWTFICRDSQDILFSEGPKGGRRKGGRGRKLSHFSFCCAFRCCVVYSPCFRLGWRKSYDNLWRGPPCRRPPLRTLDVFSAMEPLSSDAWAGISDLLHSDELAPSARSLVLCVLLPFSIWKYLKPSTMQGGYAFENGPGMIFLQDSLIGANLPPLRWSSNSQHDRIGAIRANQFARIGSLQESISYDWAIRWKRFNQKGLEVCYCLWGVPSRPSPGSGPGPVQVPSRVRRGPVQIHHVLCLPAFRTHPGPEVGAIPARPGPILVPTVPSRIGPGRAETDFSATSDSNLRFAIFSAPKRDSQRTKGSVREPWNDSRQSDHLSSSAHSANVHVPWLTSAPKFLYAYVFSFPDETPGKNMDIWGQKGYSQESLFPSVCQCSGALFGWILTQTL